MPQVIDELKDRIAEGKGWEIILHLIGDAKLSDAEMFYVDRAICSVLDPRKRTIIGQRPDDLQAMKQ